MSYHKTTAKFSSNCTINFLRENQLWIGFPLKVAKNRQFCLHAARIILPLTYMCAVKQLSENFVSVLNNNVSMMLFRKHFLIHKRYTQTGYCTVKKSLGFYSCAMNPDVQHYSPQLGPQMCLWYIKSVPSMAVIEPMKPRMGVWIRSCQCVHSCTVVYMYLYISCCSFEEPSSSWSLSWASSSLITITFVDTPSRIISFSLTWFRGFGK